MPPCLKRRDNADVEANAKAEGFDSWVLAFQFYGVWSTRHDYKYNVPLAPVVDPFVLEQTGTEAFVWTRNPFYHVIDTAGNQLPYIDKIRQQVVESGDLIPLKAMNGEVDCRERPLPTRLPAPPGRPSRYPDRLRILTSCCGAPNAPPRGTG